MFFAYGITLFRCQIFHFLVGRKTEDVVAWDDIRRAESRPMVFAVLHVVEHAQLFQVRTVLEGSVGDDHLQVAVRVVAIAVGLVELNVFHMRIACDGISLQHDVLVVVVRSWVVVDAHHAVLAVDVAVVDTDDAGIIHVAVVLRVQERCCAELQIVGIPRAYLVHHLLLSVVIVLEVRLLVEAAEPVVEHALHVEVLGRSLVDDEASAVRLPRVACHVVLVLVGLCADSQVGAAREGIVGHGDDLIGGERLPVVGALSSVLHHLQLAEFGAAVEGACADKELEGGPGTGIGIRVLEVERLQLLAIAEGMGCDESQMGVVACWDVAYQVIVYLYAIAVVIGFIVIHDGSNLRGIAIGIVHNQIGIIVIVLEFPAHGFKVLVANVEVIVLAREVAICYAPQRTLRLGLGYVFGDDGEQRLLAQVLQLVQAVGGEGVADEAAVVVIPVVESRAARDVQLHPAAVGPVFLAVERHVGLSLELVCHALGYYHLVEDERALLRLHLHRGIASLQLEVFSACHVGESAPVHHHVVVGPSLWIEDAVADGQGDVILNASHEATTVGTCRSTTVDQRAREGTAVYLHRIHGKNTRPTRHVAHHTAVIHVTSLPRVDAHGRMAVVELRGSRSQDACHDTSREPVASINLARGTKVANGGTADIAEGCRRVVNGAIKCPSIESQHVAVAVECTTEGVKHHVLKTSHNGTIGVNVLRHTEHLAAITLSGIHVGCQRLPVGRVVDEIRVTTGSRTSPCSRSDNGCHHQQQNSQKSVMNSFHYCK